MKKFWKWKNQAQTETTPAQRTLYLNGTIAEESWFDDDVTPQLFKEELNSGSGDITVWINSPGGDCVAAAQIYNMLIDYKGNVTVKIDGIAASAASVIAMAGTKVLMSPVSMMKRVKSNLSSVIGRGTKFKSRATGELEGALGLSPSKLNREGNHDIKVGFAEPRSDGGSNAKLANILEYGKHGQPAKPFLKPAKTASRQECIDAMTKALDEEVGKL